MSSTPSATSQRLMLNGFILFHLIIFLAFSGALDGNGPHLAADNINENLMLTPGEFSERPWTLLTYALMHGSVLHFFMNMFFLWQIRSIVFSRPKVSALIYVGAAIMGGAFILAIPHASGLGTVGASGALFGLLGLMTTHYEFLYLRKAMIFTLALNAAIPLLIPIISWQGHLGGFVVGAAAGLAMTFHRWQRDRVTARAILAKGFNGNPPQSLVVSNERLARLHLFSLLTGADKRFNRQTQAYLEELLHGLQLQRKA